MELHMDKNGYYRDESGNLIHRTIAYEEIYLRNKHKYPLPFSAYIVHHKNKDKTDNRLSNLKILTQEEHERIHGINNSYILDKDIEAIISGSREYERSKLLHPLVFHLIGLVLFWSILSLLIYLIFYTNKYGGFFPFLLGEFTGFTFGEFWLFILALIVGYVIFSLWWTEPLRQNLEG